MSKLEILRSRLKKQLALRYKKYRSYIGANKVATSIKKDIGREISRVARVNIEKLRKARDHYLKRTLDRGYWFKWTTRNGGSIHAGPFKYNLPKKNKPGNWHTETSYLSLCNTGYHVTRNPRNWETDGGRLFVVEKRGRGQYESTKACFKNIRFIREIKKNTPEYTALMS